VSFTLDDFGTGYSSLTYLKRLPVTRLKIDQSFVHDMLDDPDDLAIIECVVSLASAFRREVIAEGVETIEHGIMLQKLGCKLAQGYGIARPMPADQLPQWATTWRVDPSWHDIHSVSRNDLPLLFACVKHRAWIAAIEAFLMGEREVPPPMNHQDYRSGTWLYAESLDRYDAQPAFQVIKQLHRQIQTLAEDLLNLKARGQNLAALDRLGELHSLRDTLLEQLKSLERETK
jgi:hypothetical protein